MEEEKQEVLDDNGKVIRIATRKEIAEKGLMHKASFIIVKDSKGRLYLAQRKSTKKFYPLFWEIGAGGGVSVGESYEEAAKRELFEEFKIKTKIKFLFDFDSITPIYKYKGKVFLAEYDGEIDKDEEEFEQGGWFSIKDIKEKFLGKNFFAPDAEKIVKLYLKEFT